MVARRPLDPPVWVRVLVGQLKKRNNMTLKDAYDNVIVTLRELIQESKDKGLENEQVFLDFMDELNKLSVC